VQQPAGRRAVARHGSRPRMILYQISRLENEKQSALFQFGEEGPDVEIAAEQRGATVLQSWFIGGGPIN
jgi:hypothetical protein